MHNEEELISYQGKVVKREDLSAHLSNCMIQVFEIMKALNLATLHMESDTDTHITSIDVTVTEEKRLIQVMH